MTEIKNAERVEVERKEPEWKTLWFVYHWNGRHWRYECACDSAEGALAIVADVWLPSRIYKLGD